MKKFLAVLTVLCLTSIQANAARGVDKNGTQQQPQQEQETPNPGHRVIQGALGIRCMDSTFARDYFQKEGFTETVLGLVGTTKGTTASVWRGKLDGHDQWVVTFYDPRQDVLCRVITGTDALPKKKTEDKKAPKTIEDMK